jgi:ankyrin repeat protein
MFAAQSAHLEGANILISKGVDVNSSRGDGMTVLMMASASGMPPFVDMLIKHKANVNARADDGATALSFAAARGNTAAAQILIGSGAHINVSDRYKQTPLMLAANNGHADTVQLLLKAGANPNAKDFMGRTALMLASTYTNSADTVRALLAAGAHAGDKDRTGQTSCELAAARGNGACCAALGEETVTTRLPSAKQAISKSLALVQASMAEFSRKTACLSCHQEGLGRMATGLASAHGYKLDAGVRRTHLERINEALNAMRPIHERALKDPEALKQVPLMEINEIATTDTWLLAGMAAQHQAPTPASAAMTMVLARSQTPDGSWRFSGPRAPMQSSYFTFTALSIRALQTYGPKAHAAELASRITKAKTWLLTAPVKNSEDRASKLLGLKWAGATLAERQQAIDDIRIDQRTDGGWAQLPNMASDAYATGQALYALHEAGGVAVDDSVYGRGVKYLLQTQDKDGSWYVAKRAMPNNNYFDAGFPHGESQYASFNGTCWAMMALLETLPQVRMTASR